MLYKETEISESSTGLWLSRSIMDQYKVNTYSM